MLQMQHAVFMKRTPHPPKPKTFQCQKLPTTKPSSSVRVSMKLECLVLELSRLYVYLWIELN